MNAFTVFFVLSTTTCPDQWYAGADPGFFLGGGAPLRNDVTDGELKKF